MSDAPITLKSTKKPSNRKTRTYYLLGNISRKKKVAPTEDVIPTNELRENHIRRRVPTPYPKGNGGLFSYFTRKRSKQTIPKNTTYINPAAVAPGRGGNRRFRKIHTYRKISKKLDF